MRKYAGLSVLVVALVILASLQNASVKANTAPTPVVIELFTSEGCSSCPPADRLLAELQQRHTLDNAELLLLGEHVDYWNGFGWKDRYSSADFTERQRQYTHELGLESAYTPQAVIDGRVDVVGNDQRGLERAILKAASAPKPASVSLRWIDAGLLSVQVRNASSVRVLLAVTEDGLTTQVGGGENGGRTLRHAAVVRELRDLGLAKGGRFTKDVRLNWRPEWKRENSHVIVIAQQATGQVVGAASLKP